MALGEGDNTEDHAAAILWNASAWCWTEEQIKQGKLPKELDDITYRNDK